MLDSQDHDILRELSFQNDKYLMAAWDTYNILFDEVDFGNTLQIICQVYKTKAPQQNQQVYEEQVQVQA